jgi:hypothetical protein
VQENVQKLTTECNRGRLHISRKFSIYDGVPFGPTRGPSGLSLPANAFGKMENRMTGSGFRNLPASVSAVLILFLMKSAVALLDHVLPFVAPPMPLPFERGTLSFAIPSVIMPLVLYVMFRRSPATGYWGTVTYAPLSVLLNAILVFTPMFVTRPLGIPNPDPYATARVLEMAGRLLSTGLSLMLLFAVLRRPVRRWVTQREETILSQRYPSRRSPSLTERGAWVLPVVFGAITPTLVWLAVNIMVGGSSPADAMFDTLLEHLKGRGLMLDLFSMLPFIVLAMISHYNAGRVPGVTLWSVTIGGVIGILALLIPAYWVAWETIYNDVIGDEKTTGALVFFFTPLYCLATMLGGMLLGWVAARIMRRGVDDIVDDI